MRPLFSTHWLLHVSPTLGVGKLVRDLIPQEIAARGGLEPTSTLPKDEYVDALLAKLNEETFEASQAIASRDRDAVIAECADVLEVMRALVGQFDAKLQDVILAAVAKRELKGGFEGGVFLKAEHTWRRDSFTTTQRFTTRCSSGRSAGSSTQRR